MSTADDVAAIKSVIDKLEASAAAGDAPAHAAAFTDDAIRMPPNEPAIVGKDEIEAWGKTNFDQFTVKLNLEFAEVEVAGDWAFQRGIFGPALTPKAGGEPIEYSGKWLEILKRQPDGSWKIYCDIWNSDRPLP